MAADGNTSTYWLSNGSNPLSKLDIDLGTAYQVSNVTYIFYPAENRSFYWGFQLIVLITRLTRLINF